MLSFREFSEHPFAVFVVARIPGKPGFIAGTTRAADRGESGRIGLPGGKVDPGENPISAAVRESEEEGWKVQIAPNAKPLHIATVEGRTVWWYEGTNPQKLTIFKEKGRISPIEVSIKDISKSGYGNDFLINFK